MAFGKLSIDGYACEDCGATADRPAIDLCDTCLLKFYFDNANASSFADWHEPNKLDLPKFEYEWFSKGYDGGVEDVLIALIEFCGQGGILDAKNVVAWANTYGKETNLAKEQEQN